MTSAETRFSFGKNWTSFLAVIDEQRVDTAVQALRTSLGRDSLQGRRFLDAGCGSGLSSLAARRLGATVHSFDYDADPVSCTAELKRRFQPDEHAWTVERGSVIDQQYMTGLGTFDVVYSWGVLHHTGAMWCGLDLAVQRLADGGLLLVALYNDQGWKSHLWWFIKLWYCRSPRWLRSAYVFMIATLTLVANLVKQTLRMRPMAAIRPLLNVKANRGMSLKHDIVDWVGGFPYEFVSHDVLVNYLSGRGLRLVRSTRATSLGCHEVVFERVSRDIV